MTDHVADDARAATWFDGVTVPELRRRAGAKWNRFGPDVLPAWVADMDFPPAPMVREALASLLDTGDLGYPWLGVPGAPNPIGVAFAAWASRRYGWEVDPDRVVPTVDVLQPLVHVIEAATRPGDGVVIQTPIYPPFLAALDMIDRRLVDHPLGAAADGYPLDVDGLRALDPSARVLLLCNPHNPTGRVFRRNELEALAAVAVERDMLVVSDEIHADLIYPGATHVPFATLGPEVAARTVTLTSPTKSFNIAGLRLAVAVFGSATAEASYRGLPRFGLGGVNSAGLAATLAAWSFGDEWLDALVTYLDGNRRHLAAAIADRMPGLLHGSPEATYLAWIDARGLPGDAGTDPFRFFHDVARVGLNDGADFGVHGRGFVRLNFATSRAVLDEIIDRMADAVGGLA